MRISGLARGRQVTKIGNKNMDYEDDEFEGVDGKCQGCDDYGTVDDLGLCDDCGKKVEEQQKKEKHENHT